MHSKLLLRPMLIKLQNVALMEALLKEANAKHWWIGGQNSLLMAVHLLRTGNIIAIPTDTIYGLAGLAENHAACARLYDIKKRSSSKPLAVCLNDIQEINKWAITDHLPPDLLKALLPGTITVLLPRKPDVHQHLNPGVNNVGIRIPQSSFVEKLTELAGPLVLTSANISNQPSTVRPEEFAGLWPQLGGIFHNQTRNNPDVSKRARVGSTIVDLSMPGQYCVVRYGKQASKIIGTLKSFDLKKRFEVMKEKQDKDTLEEKQSVEC